MLPIAKPLKLCLVWLFGAVCSAASAATLDFELASYTVSENGSTLQVSVTRTGAIGTAAGVTVRSVDGTATAGDDFKAVSAALAWSGGDGDAQTVNISLTDDATTEGDETFTLELQNPTGDTLGATATATITISDFEEGTIEFTVTNFEANEDTGSADIVINRVNGSDGAVGITIKTADDTAKAEADYEAVDLAIAIADGETSATVPVTLINDESAELSESLTLTLSAVSGGAILGSSKEATLTISDTDSDFTASLDVIELESPVITQPPLVDLTKTSLMDPESTYLDIINEISVLQTGEVLAEQTSDGLISITLGTDKFYFHPLAVRRSDIGAEPSVLIADDHSARFVTDQDITIDVQPALGGISTLQAALEAMAIPELVITPGGNITIQADQGPAPFERNSQGQLVINNSFYDRWHFRPLGVARIVDESAEGVSLLAHPTFTDETLVSVVFKDGTDYREQILSTAPVNANDLVERIEARVGITEARVLDYGVVLISSVLDSFAGITGATEFTLLADYQVRRAASDSTILLGFFDAGDINGDGLEDFKMVYENGDEQYFLLMNAE